MSEFPAIARERLRLQQRPADHPDANLLAGYREQSLSPVLRGQLIRHLGQCDVCRAVVFMTVEQPIPAVAAPQFKVVPKLWGRWSALRWAAVSAVVMIIGSASVIMRLIPTTVTPASTAAKSVQSVPKTPEQTVVATSPVQTVANANVSRPNKKGQSSRVPSAIGQNNSAMADTAFEGGGAGTIPGTQMRGGVAGVPMVIVPRAPQKPAANMDWRLAGDGALLKSNDHGQHWRHTQVEGQTSFRSLAFAAGTIWLLRTDGTLIRSTDDGRIWVNLSSVPEASSGQPITRVRFDDEIHGTVSNDVGESWATDDGGKTWKPLPSLIR